MSCSGDPQLGWSYGEGNLGLIRPHGYLVPRLGAFLVLHCAHQCMVGGQGSSTPRPLGCNHDKRLGGIAMIPSVAFLSDGEVYLWREPILLQEWPEGDSQRGEAMFGKYQRLLKLATSRVWLGATNR